MKIIPNNGNEYICIPNWQWDTLNAPWVDHDFYYIKGGKGQLINGDKKYLLSAGSCYLLSPFERYQVTGDKRSKLNIIAIHFDFADAKGIKLPLSSDQRPGFFYNIKDTPFFETLLQRVLSSLRGNKQQEANLWMNVLYIELLDNDKAIKIPGVSQILLNQIDNICREIQKRPEQIWSIKEMANSCYLSHDHFTRLFKKCTQESPKNYLLKVKIDKAKSLLRLTSNSIEAISSSLGYKDPGFFCRQFKNKTGTTPLSYREKGAIDI